MKQGNVTKLTMIKPLCAGQMLDEKAYECELLSYDRQQEMISVILKEGELRQLSLDAIYECQIYTEDAAFSCTGKIVERFCDQQGNNIKLQVKNGFYKISIK